MTDLSGTSAVGATRNVLLPNDAGAQLLLNRQNAAGVAGSVPDPAAFQEEVIAMLRQYQQGMGDVANQGVRDQALRTAYTSPDLIGASPTQQQYVRGANAAALEPTIGGARAAITEAGDAITRLQELQQQHELQMSKQKAEKKQNIDLLLSTGTSSDIAAYLAANPETFKEAGYDPKAIAALIPALKAREQAAAFKADLENRKLQADITAAQNSGAGGGDWQKGYMPEFQTTVSAYNKISEVTMRVLGKTPDKVTKADINKLNDQDAETIGAAVAQLRNPSSTRAGTDPGNAFEPKGLGQRASSLFRGATPDWISGSKMKYYSPDEVFGGISGAKGQYDSNLATFTGMSAGNTSNLFANPTSQPSSQPKQMKLPNGTIVTLQPDGTYM